MPEHNFLEIDYSPHGPKRSRRQLVVGLVLGALVLIALIIWTVGLDDTGSQSQTSTATEAHAPTPAKTLPAATPTALATIPDASAAPPLPVIEKPAANPVKYGKPVSVISVTDGDTIRVDYKGKSTPVRFIGIDTPEVGTYGGRAECFGDQATNFTARAVAGKRVYLVRDGMQPNRDRYGRLLRFVYTENKENLNVLLVRNGFATYERQYPVAPAFRGELEEAERYATENKLGLWSACR